MNPRQIEKNGRTILYREKLAKTLPGLRADVAKRMDAEGLKFAVGLTVRIVRNEGGVEVQQLPTVDPRQKRLWGEEQDSFLREVDPREGLEEIDSDLGGKE